MNKLFATNLFNTDNQTVKWITGLIGRIKKLFFNNNNYFTSQTHDVIIFNIKINLFVFY